MMQLQNPSCSKLSTNWWHTSVVSLFLCWICMAIEYHCKTNARTGRCSIGNACKPKKAIPTNDCFWLIWNNDCHSSFDGTVDRHCRLPMAICNNSKNRLSVLLLNSYTSLKSSLQLIFYRPKSILVILYLLKITYSNMGTTTPQVTTIRASGMNTYHTSESIGNFWKTALVSPSNVVWNK